MKTRKDSRGSEGPEAARLSWQLERCFQVGFGRSRISKGGSNFLDGLEGGKLPRALFDQTRTMGTRERRSPENERAGRTPAPRGAALRGFADSARRRALRGERRTRCARARARGPRRWLAALLPEKALGRGRPGPRGENPRFDRWARREQAKRRGGNAGETGRWGAGALASALLGRARRRAYWKRAGSGSRSMRSGSTRLRYCCQH